MYDERDRVKVRNGVAAVTALAWILWIWTQGAAGTHAHHHSTTASGFPAGAAANWILMLAAMMAPVLIPPIQFLRGTGLARRRTRSTLLFTAGYTAVWMLAGAPILLLAAALGSYGLPPYVPAATVLVVTLVWQCSPAKQACLNGCHAMTELAAFGRAADTDALVFGATQGVWCTGSCWTWMLLPLLLPGAHVAAMAAAALVIFCERLDDPAPAGWRWRGLGKARRIVAGQIRMRSKTA
jgi:predicted metal-binding membrane protein